jgi:hypothetical protein
MDVAGRGENGSGVDLKGEQNRTDRERDKAQNVNSAGPGNCPRNGSRQHCGFPAFRDLSDFSTGIFDTRNDSRSFRRRIAAALASLKNPRRMDCNRGSARTDFS